MDSDTFDFTLGTALASNCIASALLGTMVAHNVLTKDAARHILDTIMLSLEKMRDAPGGSPAAIDHARITINGMYNRIDDIITK